ncbi:ABC transporter permease [Arthrobacter sp. NPDC058097]|uniref:ABC transporter permease n=1 Tax=Arthrobacter sp. NPDC058097 TaxID=3346340 RepID=UPI0036DE0998
MVRLYWHFRTLLAWSLAVLAFIAFAVTNPAFLNAGNLYSLLQSFAILALVATGLALVMIAGEFDLSIAGTIPLAGMIAVKVGDSAGVPLGVAAAIAIAVAVGVLNGWLTAHYSVPSLAVTVGTLVLTIGIGFAVAGGKIVTLTDFEPGLWLDQALGDVVSPRALVHIVFVVAAAWLMAKTWSGMKIRAVGSDRQRSSASGLPVTRVLILAFVISGLFAGVAGALQGITLASGAPGSDEATLLQAVTAAIIGGVALTGGKGSIPGVAAGAMLLAVVGNGLSLQGTSTAIIQLINGGILLLIVVIDRPLNRVVNKAVETSMSAPQPRVATNH